MMADRSILRLINVCLAILWPTLTFAAASTFGSTFEGIGLAAWLMVIVLSTVAGTTALLNRIGAELRADKESQPKIPSIPLFVASNLFGSWLSGVFFFLICEHFDAPDFIEAAMVIGASYGGARFIERTMEGVVDRGIERVALIFGISPRDAHTPRYDDRRYEPRERGDDLNARERGRF